MNEERRATLAALADVLVPAEADMPSASGAGIADDGVTRVLVALPELEAQLIELLDRAEGRDPADFIAELGDADGLGVLAVITAGGYLTDPRVTDLLAYGGRQATPLVDDLDDEVVELLESVLERGPTYRPA